MVKKEDLEEYLGKDKYTFDLAGVKPEIGMVTGLAWTAVGGVTLNVEVNVLKGKGQVCINWSIRRCYERICPNCNFIHQINIR